LLSPTAAETRQLMSAPIRKPADDPLSLITRFANLFRRLWMVSTYPFVSVGKGLRVHYTCDLRRRTAAGVKIGDAVWIESDVWINIPELRPNAEPVIIFDDGCKVGRRCVISAMNRIHFEKNVIFAPSVLVMDHNHGYEDVTRPIVDQGVTEGGTIRIEEGAWIGFGVAIVCNKGELVVGKNSVIGANSVLTRSVPPYSIVSGNPGRVVKRYDFAKGKWVLGAGVLAESAKQS
jgi:acetyltransferase-like isoleucine patch superfamily enzyme